MGVFIPEHKTVEQVLELVSAYGIDMVVELQGGAKADFLPGFQIKEGAVIGRSSTVSAISVPIDSIKSILKIDGKDVLRRESPLPKLHRSCYPSAEGCAVSPLADVPSDSEIEQGIAERLDVSST